MKSPLQQPIFTNKQPRTTKLPVLDDTNDIEIAPAKSSMIRAGALMPKHVDIKRAADAPPT